MSSHRGVKILSSVCLPTENIVIRLAVRRNDCDIVTKSISFRIKISFESAFPVQCYFDTSLLQKREACCVTSAETM